MPRRRWTSIVFWLSLKSIAEGVPASSGQLISDRRMMHRLLKKILGRAHSCPVVARLHAEAPAVVAPPATAGPLRGSSLATLLASHILRDGECVLLLLKPSLWFIVLAALPVAAIVTILCIALQIFTNPGRSQLRADVEIAIGLVTARLIWSILQWMARFYVLTDLRVLRLGGVFTLEIFDCPLRKVARTRLLPITSERLVRTGSIEIIPSEGEWTFSTWQTVPQPAQVHSQIIHAIDQAKQGF